MEQGTPITGSLAASDSDGDSLTYSLASGPANGTLTIDSAGNYTFTPEAGFSGTDSFTFQVTDSDGLSDTATVSIDVLAKDLDLSSGSEFQVSTETVQNQDDPSVAVFADGSYVVTWESRDGQDGSGAGVYGQRFDANDNPVGSEFQINSYTSGSQDNTEVATLNDGGFVVTWESNGQDGSVNGIYAQRFDSDGNTINSEFRVSTSTSGAQEDVTLTALDDGGFVAIWTGSGSGDVSGIFGQRFDSNGDPLGSEFRVNSYTTSDQLLPNVTSLTDGGFVVVWGSYGQDGSEEGIYGQRYDSNGDMVGSEFRVNSTTTNWQSHGVVTGLVGGGFVVTWESNDQDGSNKGVYGQMYDENGNEVGSEFKVNTTVASEQDDATVGALADGGFMVVWESYGQDGSGDGIYAQRYDSNGNEIGGEIQVSTYTTSNQVSPAIAVAPDGSVIVTWASEGQDGDLRGVYAHHYAVTSTGSHTFTGGDGDDSFTGGSFDDNLSGGAGADTLDGGAGNDVLAGDDGNDVLTGGAGADTLDGGAGSDTASYATSGAGVSVDLSAGTGSGGDAEGDTLTGIENLSGSAFADTLTGDSGANTLDGGDGADVLYGGNGADVLYGGDGDDSLYGGGGEDDASADTLYGGTGFDELTGGGGADTLFGGTDNDRLYGGSGGDTLVGGAGNDALLGGDGNDIFVFGSGDGTDTAFGGLQGGWTDTIQLEGYDGLAAYDGWTITLKSGHSVTATGADNIELSDDAAGTIALTDGSEISFEGIEKIEW